MGRTRAGYNGSNALGGCIKYFGTSVGDCVLQLNATILPVKSLIGKDILPKETGVCTRSPIKLKLINVKDEKEEIAFYENFPI